ncbi:MAG: ABC transporter permease [Roseivirga sp.]
MIKSFVTSAFRAIGRQKVFSTINILGLSVGISVSLMLFLFIQHELGFDKFHEKGDRIFRVVSKYTTNGGRTSNSGITFGSVVPEMRKGIPEVETATRIYNAGSTDIMAHETTYQHHNLYYTDRAFFDVFSFPSVYGGNIDKTAFDNSGIVISKKLANTMFGDKVPLGQILKMDGTEYTILDVVSVPRKSHIQFDMVVSLEGIEELHDWAYYSGLDFHSYGVYTPNSNPEVVNEKISKLYNDQMNQRFDDFIASCDNYVQPLDEIYLKSENIQSNLGAGSINTIYILAGINLLILLIAIINYVNLTTAQYEKRIKEIGVRKVIGANRKHLVAQFLGESMILTFLSFIAALGLTQLFFKPFGALMQIDAEITYWQQPQVLVTLLAVVTIMGLASGLYPALFISSFSPSKILKRNFPGMKKGTRGSKVLVTLQFVIAIVLVINLAFLNAQIGYVKNKELGFNKDQVLVVNNVSERQKATYETIAAELANSPNILEVTASQTALGTGTSGQTVHLKSADAKTAQPIGELRTQHNFLNTYDIPLTKGRDFSKNLVTDKDAFIINESGEKMLFPDGSDPLGQVIVMAGRVGPIIGVVEDFHYTHLKQQIAPLILSHSDPYRLAISVKLNTANLQSSIQHIESVLQKADPEYQLGYYFLDDYFNNMFEAEERNASLISYSSLIAVIISLVGLVALISHSLAKRMKEVAIRKVLGAKFKQLLWVLTKEFYRVILIANLLAIPIAIMVINQWLPAFAYRLSIGSKWPIFLVVAILSFSVALLMILNQVVRRTRANPAEVLANE